MWGYGWGAWLAMGVSMVLFWGLVVLGIVALVRYIARDAGRVGSGVERISPEEVLAQRFARGEIDEDEYHQRLEALRARR